jgi:lysophospholipase L1-like esterase
VSKVTRLIRIGVTQLALALTLVFVAECVLRLGFDRPTGVFEFTLTSRLGLYPPNARLMMNWGRIPYVVETNSLGFRGPEVSQRKPDGVVRIVAVGDSVTDGFFVDNSDTYPQLLQDRLAARGHRIEVINAARAGASIDKELAIVREAVVPIEPDVVLVTFVANDLSEIEGKSREEMIAMIIPRSGVIDSIRARSAVVEGVADFALARIDKGYRRSRDERQTDPVLDDSRYEIRGASEVDRNLAQFRREFPRSGPRLARAPFDATLEALVDDYVYVLDELASVCRKNEIQGVLVYFPSYAQVYDPDFSGYTSQRLAAAASAAGFRYLDLTEAFRRAASDQVVFLAPIDFHLNPAGNRVMAAAIADFLEPSGLLEQ